MNKESPPIVEMLTSPLVHVVVNNLKGNSFNEARDEQVISKGQLKEAREQEHADLKIPLFKFMAGYNIKHLCKTDKVGFRKCVAALLPLGNISDGLSGSKRKLVGDLITGDRKRMVLGDISNTGISAEVAVQPRREI